MICFRLAAPFFVTMLISTQLIAQAATQQELEVCALLNDSGASLQCYQALTQRGRIKSSPVSSDEVHSQPASQGEIPAPEPLPVGVGVGVEVEVEIVQESDSHSFPTDTVAPAASADLGAEQLRRAKAEEEIQAVRATVVEVSKGSLGHLYFHLDNGNVWQQQEARYFPYPRAGSFDVEIDRGMLGDYQLRVDGRGRMVRIRRVQ